MSLRSSSCSGLISEREREITLGLLGLVDLVKMVGSTRSVLRSCLGCMAAASLSSAGELLYGCVSIGRLTCLLAYAADREKNRDWN